MCQIILSGHCQLHILSSSFNVCLSFFTHFYTHLIDAACFMTFPTWTDVEQYIYISTACTEYEYQMTNEPKNMHIPLLQKLSIMKLLQYIAGLYSTCISWTTITSQLGHVLHTYILEHLKAVEWKASIWDHSTYCWCKTTVESSQSSFLQTNKQMYHTEASVKQKWDPHNRPGFCYTRYAEAT